MFHRCPSCFCSCQSLSCCCNCCFCVAIFLLFVLALILVVVIVVFVVCYLLSDVFVFCCLLLILLLLLSLFCCCRRSSLSFCSFYLYFVSFSDFCLLLVKPLDVEVDLYVESFANIAEANMVGNQSFS